MLLLKLRELLLALSSDLLLVAEVCKLCNFVLQFHHTSRFVLVLLEEDAVLQLLALELLHDLLVMSACLLVDFTHCLFGDWAFEILDSARFLGCSTSELRVALARRGHGVDRGKLSRVICRLLALLV